MTEPDETAATPAEPGNRLTTPAPEGPIPEGMHWDGQRYVADAVPDDDDGMSRADRRRLRADERYREQLREAEARERTKDAIIERQRETIDARDRIDVERIAAPKLTDPGDLWHAGVTLDSLRGEDGELDVTLVDAAIAETVRAHPHWGTGISTAAPSALVGWNATKPETEGGGERFVDAFKPRR